MTQDEDLTVGRTAELVGVSVRTLHHFDEIGLVVPGGRSPAGDRLYGAGDIARLQQVLVYREIGIPLARIAPLLDDPDADPLAHLRRQRTLLAERITHLTATARTVDAMIERITPMDESTALPALDAEQQARLFGPAWDPEWMQEAQDRWGGTPAATETAERSRRRTTAEWEELAAATDQLHRDLAAAMTAGVRPGDDEASALAARHRDWIGVHYPCGHGRQVILARMYTEDPRFTATYDAHAPGLAAWLREVIEEDARAHGVDLDTASWD